MSCSGTAGRWLPCLPDEVVRKGLLVLMGWYSTKLIGGDLEGSLHSIYLACSSLKMHF